MDKKNCLHHWMAFFARSSLLYKKFNTFIIKGFVVFLLCLLGMQLNVYALDFEDLDDLLYLDNSPSLDNEDKKISMDFTNADITDVLKIFSQQSGLNFIASDEVLGMSLNLYFDNVSVKDAITYILTANNLKYELKEGSNIFVVKRYNPDTELISRVYPLKYATVSYSKLKKELKPKNTGGSSGRSGGSSGISTGPKSGIVAAIKSLLTENGSIVEDERTNSLIVTDEARSFPAIEQTIADLDVRVPQILIQVEMLDISKGTADLLGVKFGDTPLTFKGGEQDSIFPFNEDNKEDDGFTFDEAQYRVSTLSFAGLAFTLQFLRTQTDTRNLARPRILTLNNETAEINVKTDEAIGLASNTTASEGTSNSSITAERVSTGVFLKVTPQVNIKTDEITMVVEPKVIEARTGQTFSGQSFKDPEERGTKAILRIKDGETIMMGGLLRDTSADIKTKVPILGSIPIVGRAFRHKDKSNSQRELVIFITPHIVAADGTAYNFDADSSLNAADSQKMVKEQKVSTKRLKAINQALTAMENQKY